MKQSPDESFEALFLYETWWASKIEEFYLYNAPLKS